MDLGNGIEPVRPERRNPFTAYREVSVVADQFRHAWITAQFGGAEHAVDDDAEIAGRAARDGYYKAMCGVRYLASMDGAPSGECAACVAIVDARCSMRGIDDRMAGRPGWLSWLFCHKQPAGGGSSERPSAPTPADMRSTTPLSIKTKRK